MSPAPTPQDWPANLDAIIAAPHHHTLILENDTVRVLDTTVQSGHTVPLHTHRWPAVQYILSWSDFIRRDAAGTILLDSRTLQAPPHGTALWSDPFPPHTLQNIGHSDLHVITRELKGPEAP